jgi:hypothetical protein
MKFGVDTVSVRWWSITHAMSETSRRSVRWEQHQRTVKSASFIPVALAICTRKAYGIWSQHSTFSAAMIFGCTCTVDKQKQSAREWAFEAA